MFVAHLLAATAALADTSVTVGNLRVTAMSNKLLRVEPKGLPRLLLMCYHTTVADTIVVMCLQAY
jgi:hypothetical protein